ncbi:GNAT family N-acetyltransferase [Tumebacillus sp. ITR2]|uniref:GNAT family N-acetyltransferase n=1 Tax=Tumebacillus amylolyticus TaxID=2801339 RepID=A0ABS1JAW7_9BACL|nr:GNAT family N-acetyltransferase [Tumebacillus amylolyticus]
MQDTCYWQGERVIVNLDIVRVGISTCSGNVRMMRLAAKWGIIEEARIRKVRIVAGEYYDSIKMGILREDWEAREGVAGWDLASCI